MCEIFGVSGQGFTFEDAKWIADLHLSLGVNYFCPHLTLYSFAGDRKRDYPPTFSYHQPYWERMRVANDYFARGGWFTRQGCAANRILVLHPIASAWSFSHPEPCAEITRFDGSLCELQDALLQAHLDFDYGDEIILERHGRVEDGLLCVATHGRYQIAVIPESYTWSSRTVELIEAFLEAGGAIFILGDGPEAIDAEPAPDRWSALASHQRATRCRNPGDLVAAVEQIGIRDVRIMDEQGREIGPVFYNRRIDGHREILFLANTDRDRTYDARVLLDTKGSVSQWDCTTGGTCAVASTKSGGGIEIRHTFPPVGSLALVVDPTDAVSGEKDAARQEIRSTSLDDAWAFERTHPNTLVLDRCRWWLNEEARGDADPVWKVRHAAFDAAGLEEYRGIQPWALAEQGVRPTESASVRMEFIFDSDIERPVAFLVVEKGEHFEILLNGRSVPTDTDDWHWDKRFRKLDMGDLIRKGTNEIRLSTEYRLGVEIEDLFIVGDFATRAVDETRYAICPEPDRLCQGDWCGQGYHFYAGNMVYRRHFDHAPEPGCRTLLRLEQPKGTLFEIRLNGGHARTLAWQPWEVDLTDELREGENDLEIVVYGSLRNAFGPLHNTQYARRGDDWWIGPESFTDEANWTDAYCLQPYGFLAPPRLVTLIPED
jgi:hypothetical protein